jgi:thiol-disulfide isomerase/thioredoxin
MMSHQYRTAAVLSALLTLAMVSLAGCSSLPSTESGLAPDFSGVTLDGAQVSLGDFQGKPLVVVFMASWCGPCREEAPEIDRFYRDHGQTVGVLAVAVNDSEADIRGFMSDNGLTFPVLFSSADATANAYGVRFLPTSVVIDSQGRIAERLVGGTTASDLSLLIDGLAR